MELLQLQEVGADNTVLCLQFGKNDIKHGWSSEQAKNRFFRDKKNKRILSQETPQIHQLMILRPPWRRRIQQQQQQLQQQLLLVITFD